MKFGRSLIVIFIFSLLKILIVKEDILPFCRTCDFVMSLLQLKVHMRVHITFSMKSQRKEVFSVWVLLWKEKFSLAAISAVVLSALFVVNLDEIDGGRGSTRCYTYAKSGSGIDFSEW